MSYQLLTGSTGLLGSYLLRDGLRAGRRMAVVVRRSNMESPRQRIESQLARWERELGFALPRPPVFEGNLAEPNLGLDTDSLAWISRHCDNVLHNAASLSFTANEKTGEPRRSNVEGTRNVLELCQATGIRQFHHVSTSYVCGLRTGRVLETELNVGQQWGNAYEETKVEAEQILRGADCLDSLTVYRPAIIVGDSTTGYSTTFHGFYTPLKIGQALVNQFKPDTIDGSPLLAALGLSGTEHKNFVPVDWVSRLITYLCDRPELYGETYHLALSRRVPVTLCQQVIEESLRRYAKKQDDRQTDMSEVMQMQETFADQMGAYQAYWRDDPEFDLTNTLRAASHLVPCEINFDMLMRMADYALKTNFGWPRPRPIVPSIDVADHLRDRSSIPAPTNQQVGLRIGLQVTGPGGGEWTLAIDHDRMSVAETGIASDINGTIHLNSKTYENCLHGRIAIKEAFRRGFIVAGVRDLSVDRLATMMASIMHSTTSIGNLTASKTYAART